MAEINIQDVLRGVREGKYRLREIGTGVYEVYDSESDKLVGYIECPPEAESPEECEFRLETTNQE